MLHRTSRLILIVLILSSCSSEQPRRPGSVETVVDAHPLLISHVTVIDVMADSGSDAYRRDQSVLVKGRRITAVGPSGSFRVPDDARVVDGRRRYLIPGLWDAHAHTSYAGEASLGTYVANGVTSVRDLGGPLPELLAWRKRVAEGTLVGPRLYVAGPNIEGAWWLDRIVELAATDSTLRSFPFLEVSPRYRMASAAEAGEAVDSLLELGADMIKFRNLRGNEFRALASEAKRRKVPLVGHAPDEVTLAEASDAGMVSIEHMETVMLALGEADEAERQAQLGHLARDGTAVTATMITDVAYRQTADAFAYAVIADTSNRIDPRRRFVSQELLKFWKFALDTKKLESPRDWAASHRRQLADLRLAREAGVPILVGTDLGSSLVYPGFSVHEELQFLVERGGLSPLDALRGATVYAARSLGVADFVSTIAPGMQADLLLLTGDPLEDIGRTQAIEGVILQGRYFDRAALDQLLANAEAAASQD